MEHKKVRLFRTRDIQEKSKVMQSLNNNPEEFQKFLGLLEHKGKKKKRRTGTKENRKAQKDLRFHFCPN